MREPRSRDRIVAEINLGHLQYLASELGMPLTPEQALSFLNQQGHAYAMWKHMMEAGERYIRMNLPTALHQRQQRTASRDLIA
jgi:hypothetical protein